MSIDEYTGLFLYYHKNMRKAAAGKPIIKCVETKRNRKYATPPIYVRPGFLNNVSTLRRDFRKFPPASHRL